MATLGLPRRHTSVPAGVILSEHQVVVYISPRIYRCLGCRAIVRHIDACPVHLNARFTVAVTTALDGYYYSPPSDCVHCRISSLTVQSCPDHQNSATYVRLLVEPPALYPAPVSYPPPIPVPAAPLGPLFRQEQNTQEPRIKEEEQDQEPVIEQEEQDQEPVVEQEEQDQEPVIEQEDKTEHPLQSMAAVVGNSIPATVGMNSNKRKRGNEDIGRNIKDTPASQDQDNTYALLQGIDVSGNDESTRTAQAALAGTMADQAYPEPGFDASGMSTGFNDTPGGGMGGPQNAGGMYSTPGQTPNKPGVGTPEWHEARKANHKEVERRRREVINEGIENIAKIVPGTEKNKGAILQRTAQYIQEQQAEINKFDSERATFDIALKELTSRNDRLKESLRQAWEDCKKWQKRCRDAGLQFEDYDLDQMGSDSFAEADLDAAIGS